ncbi:MAG: hypothetical protein GXP25_24390 [Planctomycetes bacterium]|nr:hypothetical protein [Planctomycetota bacterium]
MITRLHKLLHIEELEPRIAPVGFDVGNPFTPILSFSDGDGSTVDVYFYGVADGAGSEIEITDVGGDGNFNGDYIDQITLNAGDGSTGVLDIQVSGGTTAGTTVNGITDGGLGLSLNTVLHDGSIGTLSLGNIVQKLETAGAGANGSIDTLNITGPDPFEADVTVGFSGGVASGWLTTFTTAGDLGSSANIQASWIGSITIGGDFDGQVVTTTLQNLTVNGADGFTGGLLVNGNLENDVLVPNGGISGTITVMGDAQGTIDTFGHLTGTLQANSFNNIEIGDPATNTGNIGPTGVIDSATTINSLIIYGVNLGTVTAPGGITTYEEHGSGSGTTLNAGNPRYVFTDSDGDTFQLTFSGAGQARVIDESGNAPDGTDIHTISFMGTSDKTSLMIKNLMATGSPLTLDILDLIETNGNPLGALRIYNAGGQISVANNITIDGNLGQLFIKGNLDGVDLHTLGNLSKAFVFGSTTNSLFDIDGDLVMAKMMGPVTGSTMFDVEGDTATFMVQAAVTGSTLDFGGQARMVTVKGDFNTSTLTVGSTADKIVVQGGLDTSTVGAGALGTFTASGSVVNSTITGTASISRANIRGNLDQSRLVSGGAVSMIDIRGNVINDSAAVPIVVGGDLGRLAIRGNVDNTPFSSIALLTVAGNLDLLSITGTVANTLLPAVAHIDVTGTLGKALFRSAVSDTKIEAGAGGDMVYLGGNFTNSVLSFPDFALNRLMGKGNMVSSTLTVGAALPRLQLKGILDGTTVNVTGNMAQLKVNGMNGGSFTVGNGVSSFTVSGDITGGNLSITGAVDKFVVAGTVDPTTIDITGDVGFMRLGGAVSATTLTVTGGLSRLFVFGALNSSAISVTGLNDFVQVRSGGTDSSLDLGGSSRVFLYGDSANLDVTIGGDLPMLTTKGVLGAGSEITVNGALAKGSFGGDLDGATVTVNGDAPSLSVNGALRNASQIIVTGDSGTLTIKGGTDGGTTITVGSLSSLLSVSGTAGGDATVTNGMGANSKMQFSGDVSGTVTVDGVINDTAQVLFSNDLSGTLDIGTDLRGSVLISGSVTGVGDRILIGQDVLGVLDVTGSLASANVTIGRDMMGTLLAQVFGDVTITRDFTGQIGDSGTQAGSGNTLTIGGLNAGGVVTPANAFETYA